MSAPNPPRTSILLLLAAALTLHGCRGEPAGEAGGVDAEAPTTRVDSAGIEVVTTRIDASAPTCTREGQPVRIGSREGDEASALFGVEDAVRLADGRIAVLLDGGNPAVAVFDSTGEAQGRWGRRGEGPGEFKDTYRIWSRNDSVIVLDLRPVRFHYFDPSGEWVRTVQPEPVVFERPQFVFPLPGGQGYVSETQRPSSRDMAAYDEVPTVARFDEDGVRGDTLGDFWKVRHVPTDPERRIFSGPIFGALGAFVPAGQSQVAYAPGRAPQLEVMDLDGTTRRIIRWQARERVVRPADVEAYERDLRRRFLESLGASPQTEAAIQRETGDHMEVAERFPGHGRVLAATGGRVWVEDYRRPLDEGPATWYVFEPSGDFTCRVAVPEDWYLRSADAHHLVATTRDELDVEFVWVQAVGLPRAAGHASQISATPIDASTVDGA